MGRTTTAPVTTWELDTGVRSAGTAALHAVRAVSADETWAVGGVLDPDSGRMRALVGRWTGEFGFVRPADVPRALDVSLFGVDWSGQHVWAVGAVSDGAGGGRARIERYSRRQGTAVAVPGPAVDRDNALHAVSMVAPDEGWAVGGCGPSAGTAFTRPLIARWDGTVWRAVPCPRPGAHNRLDAVSARCSDDVWAVGQRTGDGCEDRPEALVLHWNGERWVHVPVPEELGAGTELRAVAAVGPNSVWATGSTVLPGQVHGVGVVLHWDGTTWRSMIEDPEPVTEVTGVAAVSEEDVWFSAYALRPGGTENVHVGHWDGERVGPAFTGPLPQGHVGSALNAITATGDRVTAVGWRITTDTPFQLPAALVGCSSASA
jgi:hypothetical protein